MVIELGTKEEEEGKSAFSNFFSFVRRRQGGGGEGRTTPLLPIVCLVVTTTRADTKYRVVKREKVNQESFQLCLFFLKDSNFCGKVEQFFCHPLVDLYRSSLCQYV